MINPKEAIQNLMGPNGKDKFKGNKIRFVDIHILDGCNFNCARCLKFSPLCKGLGLADKELMFKSLEELAEVTKCKPIEGFSVLGGEPLIHPDLLEYLDKIREIFPTQSITIITNGFAIPKMPKEFFENLIKNDVWLAISKYQNKDFYKPIEKILWANDCGDRFVYSAIQPVDCCLFMQPALTEHPDKEPEEVFKDCGSSLVVLKDGKLWQCSLLCTKYLLNDFFGTEFKEYEEDGITIKDHTLEEIVEFLKKPKKGCKYCTTDIYNNLYFPEHTKYQKSEWIKNN